MPVRGPLLLLCAACEASTFGHAESGDTTTLTTVPTSTGTTEPTIPTAAALHLGFSQIKQFDFTWTPAPWASSYQLLERLPGADEYAPLGDAVDGSSVSWTMPLPLRLGASYILRACDDPMDCLDSAPVDVTDSMASAVGYFKSTHPDVNDDFGGAIAVSADGATLVVAANAEWGGGTGTHANPADNSTPGAGAVSVFTRSGADWALQAYLKASNTDANDYFGASLALSPGGETLAVGAKSEASASDDPNNDDEPGAGAVYVFRRVGDAWAQTAYLKAENPSPDDAFGTSLALADDGKLLAVGAESEAGVVPGVATDQLDKSLPGVGAVYLFRRSGDTWSQTAFLKASNAEASKDSFGASVDLSPDGKTLAVGAPNEDSAAAIVNGPQANEDAVDAGAVYVFVHDGDAWSQQAYVKGTGNAASARFGTSVSLDLGGDLLAVGAPGEASDAGAVYVFQRDATVWSQTYQVLPASPDPGDRFGAAVELGLSGTLLAVGAPAESSPAAGVGGDATANSASKIGAAYLYKGPVWSQVSYLKPPNPAVALAFGSSLAFASDGAAVFIGANHEQSNAPGINGDQTIPGSPGSGAVYAY